MPDHPPSPVLKRAQAGIEADRAKAPSLTIPYLKVGTSLSGIFAAGCMEVFAASTAMHAQWPATSGGADLGTEMGPMAFALGFYLLLGHVLLRQACEQFGSRINRTVDAMALAPLMVLVSALALFMYSSVAQTTGSDNDGALATIAGPAFGIVCASLASVSFLSAHALAGKLMEGLTALVEGRRYRAKLADAERELKKADDSWIKMKPLRRDIETKEQPGYLEKKAASEAAGIVGSVAARAHELHTSIELRGGVEPRDIDVTPFPDVPLPVIERLRDDLKKYDTAYFLNILKSEA